jgi:hypothetical protein
VVAVQVDPSCRVTRAHTKPVARVRLRLGQRRSSDGMELAEGRFDTRNSSLSRPPRLSLPHFSVGGWVVRVGGGGRWRYPADV